MHPASEGCSQIFFSLRVTGYQSSFSPCLHTTICTARGCMLLERNSSQKFLFIPNQKYPSTSSLSVVYFFLVRCAYNDPKPWLPPPPLSKDPIETLIIEDAEGHDIVDLTSIDSESFESLRKNVSPTSTTFIKMEK